MDCFPLCPGERRIRVHTLCLPVVSQLNDVYLGADVQAITGLLANMGKCLSVCVNYVVLKVDTSLLPYYLWEIGGSSDHSDLH